MAQEWIAVLAQVEWHSAGTGRSTPAYVRFGGERLPVKVLRRAYLGPKRAGEGIAEEVVVRDERRRVFRIRVRGELVLIELAINPPEPS